MNNSTKTILLCAAVAAGAAGCARERTPEPETAVSWADVRQAYEATLDDWEWAEDATELFARHGVAGASGTDDERMLEIRCAAEEGNPGAQLLLGLSYAFGLVPGASDAESRELAVLWCRLGRTGDGQAGFHASMPVLSDAQVRAVADETRTAN